MAKKNKQKYASIIEKVFFDHYTEGTTDIPFFREDITKCAGDLGIDPPKNIGDLIYSYRYRASFPESIEKTAPEDKEWVIHGTGSSQYSFSLANISHILPNPNLELIPIPDNTPEIISMYQLSDEQSLLCKIRYNRLIDVFLGIVSYSMQNHLRTQIKDIGQIELDELYVGVNKKGQHFIIPVEAKVGRDMVGIVQLKQDIEFCKHNFPDLICIPIAVHKMEQENQLCLFRLDIVDDTIKIIEEKHYKLILNNGYDRQDIRRRNADQTDV